MTDRHCHSNQTQVYWTCKAPLEGRTITHLDEIGEVQGWCLCAITQNLRSNYDWPIHSNYRCPQNIAHCWLRKGVVRRGLRFPKSASKLRTELKAKSAPRTSPDSPDAT